MAPAEAATTAPVTGAERRSGRMRACAPRLTRGTGDGAQIVRVLDLVEGHQDQTLAGLRREALQEALQGLSFLQGREQSHALVAARAATRSSSRRST